MMIIVSIVTLPIQGNIDCFYHMTLLSNTITCLHCIYATTILGPVNGAMNFYEKCSTIKTINIKSRQVCLNKA